MDSFLILPAPLKDLCKSFGTSSAKDIFPYLLSDINYNGPVPDFKYFSKKVSIEEYLNYKKRFVNQVWNFKREAIKYCELDCISLYEVITKFNKLIFNKFQIDMTKYPTLPSLAFGPSDSEHTF